MSKREYREFWITQSIKSNNYCAVLERDDVFIGYSNVHVIEHAAYQELEERIKTLEKVIAVYEWGLKFYACAPRDLFSEQILKNGKLVDAGTEARERLAEGRKLKGESDG